MRLATEIKRKIFHNLSLIYLILYAVAPLWFTIALLGFVLVVLMGVEFLRLRRPELNDWFLKKFGGIHRESEIMRFSGIFWTLLGCWLTMIIFTNKKIVLPAIGFLVFGDSAAALGGKMWGTHFWKSNPEKTMEGSGCFVIVAIIWAMFYVRWPVAILGALAGAWIEIQPFRWNDNLWIPLLSGAALSVLNLVLGRK